MCQAKPFGYRSIDVVVGWVREERWQGEDQDGVLGPVDVPRVEVEGPEVEAHYEGEDDDA